VPYDYRNALLTQDQIPNWVFGQNIPEGGVRVGTPSGPMLGAPSAESTMRTVEQRRAFDYQRQKAEAEAAAARQAQSEAASRAPTSGEVVLELDPVTGKLRSTSQGMKGATPEVLASTGRSLESASQKIASGQKFALSAEERIAWEKTRVDLSVIDAGLGKLSDKALAEKAMDRAWVEETIAKARQKAKAFEEIEKRAKDAQQANRARAERERLMDVLETLEPQLSRPRATSVKEQGPKTREAIRNRLAPGNQNNLRND
jgi:DNA repair exonuclease SbcCD ATPase subunit